LAELDRIESIFFDVLKDLQGYLNDLTLVGGWMPYVYTRFLWDNVVVKPITTVDIDFGFGMPKTRLHPETIFEILSPLDYTERHPRMDRMYPVVLYKQGKIPIDFITFPEIANNVIEKFVGTQININKIDKFDFLLKHRIPVNVKDKNQKVSYRIYCPKPSSFLYHKGATFIDGEGEQKQAKDLHYMYFILRYAPNIDSIFEEVIGYKNSGYFPNILIDLNKYFEKKSSQGCLMVERENGPDYYMDDLRQDIFERFKKLRELF